MSERTIEVSLQVQNSYKENKFGSLYVVPSPIGNLEDMTFRAIQTLKDVELIAAEDTRHTRKLLNHFNISKPLTSYHEHNKREKTDELIQQLLKGDHIAIVSDAGMPAISDPGADLVQASIANEINVVVLPGANAALSALVGSGLSTERFHFFGFLPRKKQQIEEQLEELRFIKETIIFYESPFRVKQTLQVIEKVLGNREVALVRELTKLHEQYVRGHVQGVGRYLKENDIKGECCLVVEGSKEDVTQAESKWWENLSIEEHVNYYEVELKVHHKDALKKVAVDRNVSKKVIYNHIHVKK